MQESELNSKEMKDLFGAMTNLRTPEESKKFLRDLCTFSELQAMAERWQIARRVQKGESYRSIAQNTGSSTATITRVAHWVHHGLGGYKLVLDRMKA